MTQMLDSSIFSVAKTNLKTYSIHVARKKSFKEKYYGGVEDTLENDFLIAIKGRTNKIEYQFLLYRVRYRNESIAETGRRLGIKETYARKIASRLRDKMSYVLGINKRQE